MRGNFDRTTDDCGDGGADRADDRADRHTPIDDAVEADRCLGPAEWGEIEELLRRMPLRSPRPALDARVHAALGPRLSPRVRWACVGAAAAVLAAAVGAAPLTARLRAMFSPSQKVAVDLRRGGDSKPVEGPIIKTLGPTKPVLPDLRVERTVARLTDEGIVGQFGDTPLQRFRRVSVRQMWLVDPEKGTRLRATVPKEEVIVVRVQPF